MNDVALFGKAMSDATRVRILAALRRGEVCVCELADALELGQSTLSNHLQVVRQAGLVTTRKDGKWIYYGLEAEQASLVDAVFAHFRLPLEADRRLQRDAERLEQRFRLRENGCCILGFAQLNNSDLGGES